MPRSPSRDLSDRYIGNRGYFRRPDRIFATKYILTGIALVFACGWITFDLFFLSESAYSHTHGPLANVHAALDTQCAECHIGFSFSDSNKISPFDVRDRWNAMTCEKCHPGPAHHATVTPKGAEFHSQCSNCHHDHLGRSASLIRISDDHCTSCHNDLNKNHITFSPNYASTITGFPVDHPEFRILNANPSNKPFLERKLKFSHSLHMTPGLVYRSGSKGALTLDRLKELSNPAMMERYRKSNQTNSSLVTLECTSCHKLDPGVSGDGNLPVLPEFANTGSPSEKITLSDGAYYLPIRFETHCQTCHPIRSTTGTSGEIVISSFDLPHGKQPKELLEYVASGYTRRLIDPKNPVMATLIGPGTKLDPREQPSLVTFRKEIDRLTNTAMTALCQPPLPFREDRVTPPSGGNSCGKCHDLKGSFEQPETVQIVGPPGRPIWFPHGRFNHTSHRGAKCATCHPGTEAAFFGEGWTAEKEPIRIRGIDSCRECHGPLTKVIGTDGQKTTLGGIRYDCTDCHRYHNGDFPLQGRGANARNIVDEKSVPPK
jgi:hypothetical protein